MDRCALPAAQPSGLAALQDSPAILTASRVMQTALTPALGPALARAVADGNDGSVPQTPGRAMARRYYPRPSRTALKARVAVDRRRNLFARNWAARMFAKAQAIFAKYGPERWRDETQAATPNSHRDRHCNGNGNEPLARLSVGATLCHSAGKKGRRTCKSAAPYSTVPVWGGTSRIFVGPNLISVRGLENRFRASYPQPMRCCTRQDEATPALQGLRTQVEHNGAPCGVCIAAKSTRHFYAYD